MVGGDQQQGCGAGAVPQPVPARCDSLPEAEQRLRSAGRFGASLAFVPVLMDDTQMLLSVFFCTAVTSPSWHPNAITNAAVSLETGLEGAAFRRSKYFCHCFCSSDRSCCDRRAPSVLPLPFSPLFPFQAVMLPRAEPTRLLDRSKLLPRGSEPTVGTIGSTLPPPEPGSALTTRGKAASGSFRWV